MPENIAQTVQKVIQDLVAPDLRELKTTGAANQKQTEHQFAGLQKQMDQRFDAQDDKFAAAQKQTDQRFDAQNKITDAQFKAIMAAIAEVKAQNNLHNLQAISALSERGAILESRHQ